MFPPTAAEAAGHCDGTMETPRIPCGVRTRGRDEGGGRERERLSRARASVRVGRRERERNDGIGRSGDAEWRINASIRPRTTPRATLSSWWCTCAVSTSTRPPLLGNLCLKFQGSRSLALVSLCHVLLVHTTLALVPRVIRHFRIELSGAACSDDRRRGLSRTAVASFGRLNEMEFINT